MFVTLKPAHFKTGKRGSDRVHVFPSWVSNGDWAIQLAAVKNRAVFEAPEVVKAMFPAGALYTQDSDRAMDQILAPLRAAGAKGVQTFTLTAWTHVGTGKDRKTCALATCGAQFTLFDARYLELLGLEPGAKLLMMGPDTAAVTELDDPPFVLMPCGLGDAKDRDQLIEPLTSLVHLRDQAAEEAIAV